MGDVPANEKWTDKWRGMTVAKTIFSSMEGKKYSIAFDTSKSTAVAITQTGVKKSSSSYSLLRLDRPHKGANYNHVNINHRISGKPDPHLKMPPGAIQVGTAVAKICKWYGALNDWILYPAYVATEVYEIGMAMNKDLKYNTTRNTAEKGASLIGVTSSGYTGSFIGGSIGSAIFPGVGTVIGSLFGSVFGTYGGIYAANRIIENVFNPAKMSDDVEQWSRGNVNTTALIHSDQIYDEKPQPGTEFENMHNSSGLHGMSESHIELSTVGLATGKTVAGVCTAVNKLNKVAVPVAIAVDAIQTGVSVYNDGKHGTTRNTVETVAGVAGGWGGGYGGAMSGAALGTVIFPGIGTFIGGLCGAIGGAIGGSIGASAITEKIGDACEYNMLKKKCKKCGEVFEIRQYRGEKVVEICPKCA